MSTEVGKLHYDLSVDDSKLQSGLNNADKSVQGFSAGLKGAGAALAGAFSVHKVVEFGKAVVTSGAQVEQWGVAFETMVGSADRATKLLSDIREFAKVTPFNQKDLIEGSKSLLAYGVEAEKIIPTLNTLGNITAGVGREKMPQLILALGQVKAAGKLTGQELRQFTEAGVGLLQELAKSTGKSAAQVKADMENGLAPSFAQVEEALANMSKEGGQFHDLMQKQSQTTAGKWSNFQDKVQMGMASLGQKLLPVINAIITGLDWLVSGLKILGEAFQDFFEFLTRHKVLLFALVGVLVLLAGVALVAVIVGLWSLVAALVATGVAWLVAFWPVVLIAAAIGAAAYLIISNWETLKQWFNTFMEWLKNTWNSVYAYVTNPFKDAYHWVIDTWNGVWDWFKNLPDRIKNGLSKLKDTITAPFKEAFNYIARAWNNTVGKISIKAPDWVPNIGGKSWSVPKIPEYRTGVENFSGGLAFVHKGEALVNMAPGTSVIRASDVRSAMGSGKKMEINIGRIDSPETAEYLIQRINRNYNLEGMGLSPVGE